MSESVRGERRCYVGHDEHGITFAQYVRADWADAQITALQSELAAAKENAMHDLAAQNVELRKDAELCKQLMDGIIKRNGGTTPNWCLDLPAIAQPSAAQSTGDGQT